MQPFEFVIGTPQNEQKSYFDKSGKEHNARFSFIHIKNLDKRKMFLTTLNAGIQTIATPFEYEAEWLSPKIGG